MPSVSRFMEQSEYFPRHLSSSNDTRGGVFGLFTGLSSYYWKSFEILFSTRRTTARSFHRTTAT